MGSLKLYNLNFDRFFISLHENGFHGIQAALKKNGVLFSIVFYYVEYCSKLCFRKGSKDVNQVSSPFVDTRIVLSTSE